MRSVRLLLVLALTASLASCDALLDPSGGGEVADAELSVVRMAPSAPALSDTVVSFWAVRGQQREVQISYQSPGYTGKCLRFVVPAQAVRAGDFAGDSVRITIRVLDTARFNYQFEPAGLQFDSAHPAQLEIRYKWANPDYNGDGVVDAFDTAAEQSLAIWRQEQPGDPWTQLLVRRHAIEPEVHADIEGFTRYALASN
jgi:hypothetical protein